MSQGTATGSVPYARVSPANPSVSKRWTHLLRFSEVHTGYATFRQGNTSQPDHLEAVGDNVHAAGQIVAVFNPRQGRWETKGGEHLRVLVRPSKGQAATPEAPHKVLVWQTEMGWTHGPCPEPAGPELCIPWIRYEDPSGEMKWDPAPFRPTCDEVARRIDESERLKRRGRPA